MIYPVKYTHFGYDFLDRVDAFHIHSGVDFNYGRPNEDLGMPVKSIANGVVVYSDYVRGWGHVIVIYHAAYSIWSRYAHLQGRRCTKDMLVEEGEVIGSVGNTGNSSKPHLHFDIIKNYLWNWARYTFLWSSKKVQEYYHDPIKYLDRIITSEKGTKSNSKSFIPSSWAAEHWDWLREHDLVSEASDPKGNIDYEKLAVILHRFFNKFNQF